MKMPPSAWRQCLRAARARPSTGGALSLARAELTGRRRYAAGLQCGQVVLCDGAEGRQLTTLRGHTAIVNAIRVWEPADGTFRVRGAGLAADLADLRPARSRCPGSTDSRMSSTFFRLSSSPQVATALSSGFGLAGSVTADPVLRVPVRSAWGCRENGSGVLLTTLHGHVCDVMALSLSLDGTLLFSASADGELRLWNLVTGAHSTLLWRPPQLPSAGPSPQTSNPSRDSTPSRSGPPAELRSATAPVAAPATPQTPQSHGSAAPSGSGGRAACCMACIQYRGKTLLVVGVTGMTRVFEVHCCCGRVRVAPVWSLNAACVRAPGTVHGGALARRPQRARRGVRRGSSTLLLAGMPAHIGCSAQGDVFCFCKARDRLVTGSTTG
jgi:hypothetical protein